MGGPHWRMRIRSCGDIDVNVRPRSLSGNGAVVRRQPGHCNDHFGQCAMASTGLHDLAFGTSGKFECSRTVSPNSSKSSIHDPWSLTDVFQFTWTFSINMIIRYGLEGWSVWVVYVFVGIMEWTLIGTAFLFHIRDKNSPGAELDVQSRRGSEVCERSDRWSELLARSRTPSTVSRSARPSNVGMDERRPLLSHA